MAPTQDGQSARFDAVEMLRVLAAFGVVCFHDQKGPSEFRDVFYAGLVCFLIISVWFTLQQADGTPRQDPRAFARLMIPWAVWSGVFLARDVVVNGPPTLGWPLAAKIWAGTGLHLWYVPFIAIVLAAIRWTRRRSTLFVLEVAAWAAIALLTAFAGVWRPWSLALPLPFPQYVHALFPVFAGVILYADCQRGRFVGTAFVACAALWLIKLHGVGVPYVVGVGLCAAAFALRHRIQLGGKASLTALAETTFGVYLLHPLLFYPARRLVGSGDGLAAPIVVFVAATAAVLLVRRFGGDALRFVFGLRPRAS